MDDKRLDYQPWTDAEWERISAQVRSSQRAEDELLRMKTERESAIRTNKDREEYKARLRAACINHFPYCVCEDCALAYEGVRRA
jgi:hypothetical protein